MNVNFEASGASHLLKTIAFLCERSNFGYAGLDDGYRVIWRYGDLASWIPLDVDVCRHTDLFFGLEKQLLDLQDDHGSCVTLPRVGISSAGGEGCKISVETFWDDLASVYHVVVHRLVAESEVELELLKQIRARRLAEDNFQSTREKLARQQMLLDIVMEHLPVAAAIFDERRQYLFATRRWAHSFRIECEPLIGRDLFEAGPAVPDAEKRRFEASLAGLAPKPELNVLNTGEAALRGHRWTHRGWTHSEGTHGGVLTAIEDVTDIVTENRRLSLDNEQLRVTNRQLDQFASIIAHDLSAPLRSLHDVIDEFERANPAIAERRSFPRIRAHAERMKNILDGMRDYQQALCLGPLTKSVNICALVREIVDTLPDKWGFGLEMSLKVEEIMVHAGLLDLVLRNLLDNAIKHHDRACGCLSVSSDEEDDAWLISIEDDGPGMPLAEQDALRDGRIQLASAERSAAGRKGLPIVKRTLDAIGGRVDVHSDPSRERGTKFVIRWPKSPSGSTDTA